MDALTQWELTVNLFFQGLGTWLLPIMSAITWLGSEYFYMIALTLIYWCLDSALGARIGLILMLANSVGGVFKVIFHTPRPYWIDPRVSAFSAETSFGLPSGHTLNATSVFGITAVILRKKWVWLAAVGIIILMGISRIYLGMHFLRDVVGGLVIGTILLFLFAGLEEPLVNWFKKQHVVYRICAALLSALLMIVGALLTRIAIIGWEMPESWYSTALRASDVAIDPLSVEGIFTAAGVWFGLLAGLSFIINGSGAFEVSGPWSRRILRYLVGIVGLLVLYAGLGALFPDTPDLLGYSLRFVRYTLIGLWTAWLAPLLFIKLGLAQPRKAV